MNVRGHWRPFHHFLRRSLHARPFHCQAWRDRTCNKPFVELLWCSRIMLPSGYPARTRASGGSGPRFKSGQEPFWERAGRGQGQRQRGPRVVSKVYRSESPRVRDWRFCDPGTKVAGARTPACLSKQWTLMASACRKESSLRVWLRTLPQCTTERTERTCVGGS